MKKLVMMVFALAFVLSGCSTNSGNQGGVGDGSGTGGATNKYPHWNLAPSTNIR